MKSRIELCALFVGITGRSVITGNRTTTYNSRIDKIDSRIIKSYNREM
jgi:hypothetical protein